MQRPKRFYNSGILTDKSIPEDTRFLTSITLKKDSYAKMDRIMKTLPHVYVSKGQVVDAALNYFIKHFEEIEKSKVNKNA